ncbi:hypothetical protein GV791_14745 [Nocardia cyriacigeorgica]|uniref:Uncharacterized protein n=1 Tax=Nocardia cyriacigeorgica TaxID=135487 RepID=A0A6P1CR10_9NOCA|nr:hypothetical protein [Nocardia cyriacigeorgica]NEW33814.1 hypothetical protein [Nocardia cyriacigeorgica]
MPEFTEAERALLRALHDEIGHVIASPDDAIDDMRHSQAFYMGRGFHWRATKTALEGQMHEWIEDAWYPDGRVMRWRTGALLWEARITYARLQRWVESLPPKVRAQALTWWRIHPVDTRDLHQLAQLTLYAINLDDPEPKLFEIQETAYV